MRNRIAGFLILAAVALTLPSCTKLPQKGGAGKGLEDQPLAAPDAIRADWGNLVGVSSVEQYPDLVQLWLQDPNGNIRVVVYNTSTNELLHAKLIHRN
jgi:hypothetical protein